MYNIKFSFTIIYCFTSILANVIMCMDIVEYVKNACTRKTHFSMTACVW